MRPAPRSSPLKSMTSTRQPQRRTTWRRLFAVAALVALANPGVRSAVAALAAEAHLASDASTGTAAAGPAAAAPTTAPAPGGSPDAYTFARGRWNPCAPLHYVINDAQAPSAGAADDVHATVALLSAAMGVEFIFDGPSSAIPTKQWARQPYEGRSGWAPLSFAWATDAQTDLLDGYQYGTGGGDVLNGVYVTGSVVIDVAHDPPAGFGPGTRGALLLHEAGHAMGLDHLDDPTQIMHPHIGEGPGHLGAGDLAGLAQVGRNGGCLETPAAPW